MTAVPVPATPPGCEDKRPVAPGALAVWRVPMGCADLTITLGHSSEHGPWIRLHTGPGTLGPHLTPAHRDLSELGAATTAIATAHGWLARWRQVAPEGQGQTALFTEATS